MSRIGKHVVHLGSSYEPLSDENERAQTLYFNWLCVLVHADDYLGKEWYILAKTLHDIEYYWLIPNDDNRANDGIKLREVWLSTIKNEAEDLGVGTYIPLDALSGPCTMLEMMVGLASRIESDIMQRDDEGNRTWIWFWHMVSNLLGGENFWDGWYSDDVITPVEGNTIREMVRRCLDREYEADGFGGCLFPITQGASEACDRREVELWYQAQDWITENFGDELYN